MSETLIRIDQDGRLQFVWDDDVGAALRPLGEMSVQRVSHVEPTTDARWEADMSPVSGPVLGPFGRRADALAAEVAWLQVNLFGV